MFFFQALLYGSCVSQKDNITKHACDKEFQVLKACIRQAVSFLVDWSGSLFFLCLISLDIMLDFKPQTQLSWQDSQMGAQKCPFREWGDKKESLSFIMQHILWHTCPEFVSVQTLLNISSLNEWLQGIQWVFFSQDSSMFLELKPKSTYILKHVLSN